MGIALPEQVSSISVLPDQVKVGVGTLANEAVIARVSVEMKMHGERQTDVDLVLNKAKLLAAQRGCNILGIQSSFVDPSMGNGVIHFLGLCYHQ